MSVRKKEQDALMQFIIDHTSVRGGVKICRFGWDTHKNILHRLYGRKIGYKTNTTQQLLDKTTKALNKFKEQETKTKFFCRKKSKAYEKLKLSKNPLIRIETRLTEILNKRRTNRINKLWND